MERRTGEDWRSGAESNRHTRICSPLHHHSATGPARRRVYPRHGAAGQVRTIRRARRNWRARRHAIMKARSPKAGSKMNATIDFVGARNRLLDRQLRPHRISDPRILTAMREIPREQFLPPALRPIAYVDADIQLGRGRVMMEPLVIA